MSEVSSEADPDLGFMARSALALLQLCPVTNPGSPVSQYKPASTDSVRRPTS